MRTQDHFGGAGRALALIGLLAFSAAGCTGAAQPPPTAAPKSAGAPAATIAPTAPAKPAPTTT